MSWKWRNVVYEIIPNLLNTENIDPYSKSEIRTSTIASRTWIKRVYVVKLNLDSGQDDSVKASLSLFPAASSLTLISTGPTYKRTAEVQLSIVGKFRNWSSWNFKRSMSVSLWLYSLQLHKDAPEKYVLRIEK